MIIKLAIFDGSTLEALDVQMDVLGVELISSNDIRMRERYSKVFTFRRIDEFRYYYDYCLGAMYTIEITPDNYDWLTYLMECRGYKLDVINCSIIHCTLDEFNNGRFKVIERNLKVNCFVANRSDEMDALYRKRQHRVNLVPSFLIKIKQKEYE